MEALNQAINYPRGGRQRGGDVRNADGLAKGPPDGADELWASVGGDGCWHNKVGDQVAMRVLAQSSAVVEASGTASIHLVVLSITVKRYL